MITLSNVNFSFGKFKMQDISFTINKGDIVAITGNNASGKTTLLEIIFGILKAKGEILIDGSTRKETKAKLGIVFQNPDNQIIYNNVYDDICFTLKNHNIPKEEWNERVTNALSLVSMETHKKDEIFKMSTGQKQRIVIANMLALRPDIIIFDESTSYLDSSAKQDFYDLLLRLKNLGITVIFTTNILDEIVYSDKVLLLSNGNVKLYDDTKNILKNLDAFREEGMAIPLKLMLIEKFELSDFAKDKDLFEEISRRIKWFLQFCFLLPIPCLCFW